MKGLLGGAFWGLFIGGVAVVVGSLNTAQPAGVAPPQAPQTDVRMAPSPEMDDDTTLALPDGDGENLRPALQTVAEPDAPEVVPDAETATLPKPATDTPEATLTDAPAAGDAPKTAMAVDKPVTLDTPLALRAIPAETATPEADTTPLAAPRAAPVTADLSEPDTSGPPDRAGSLEEPVLPSPQAIAPQTPVVEDDLFVSTAPSAPVTADADADADAVVVVDQGDGAEDTETAAGEPDTPDDTANETVVTTTAPEVVESEITPTPGTPLAIAPDRQETTAPVISGDVPDMADDGPDTGPSGDQPDVARLPDQPDDPDTNERLATEDQPQAAPTDTASEDPAPAPPAVISIGDAGTAPALPGGAADVTIRRPADDVAQEPDATQTAPEDEIVPDAPAFVRFAADFENPESKPLMSIVLLDEGSLQNAPRLLAGVPFPVTVVLDAGSPDAADRLAAYRAAGIEVGVRARLPLAAQATDIEVAMEAAFAALPETVVMVDPGDGNLQSDRAVTEMAVTSLADRGWGLLTMPKGFNSALQVAGDLDVPAGLFYRDLDGEGQDARVIRRFMDQAAFKARQESGVVLLGRVRPDTISALNLWGNANRAGQVAMAPVTAVLGQ